MSEPTPGNLTPPELLDVYLANLCQRCPWCRAVLVERSLEIEEMPDRSIRRRSSCTGCLRTWHDVYRVSEMADVRQGPQKLIAALRRPPA